MRLRLPRPCRAGPPQQRAACHSPQPRSGVESCPTPRVSHRNRRWPPQAQCAVVAPGLRVNRQLSKEGNRRVASSGHRALMTEPTPQFVPSRRIVLARCAKQRWDFTGGTVGVGQQIPVRHMRSSHSARLRRSQADRRAGSARRGTVHVPTWMELSPNACVSAAMPV